jgi:hypothetical protein
MTSHSDNLNITKTDITGMEIVEHNRPTETESEKITKVKVESKSKCSQNKNNGKSQKKRVKLRKSEVIEKKEAKYQNIIDYLEHAEPDLDLFLQQSLVLNKNYNKKIYSCWKNTIVNKGYHNFIKSNDIFAVIDGPELDAIGKIKESTKQIAIDIIYIFDKTVKINRTLSEKEYKSRILSIASDDKMLYILRNNVKGVISIHKYSLETQKLIFVKQYQFTGGFIFTPRSNIMCATAEKLFIATNSKIYIFNTNKLTFLNEKIEPQIKNNPYIINSICCSNDTLFIHISASLSLYDNENILIKYNIETKKTIRKSFKNINLYHIQIDNISKLLYLYAVTYEYKLILIYNYELSYQYCVIITPEFEKFVVPYSFDTCFVMSNSILYFLCPGNKIMEFTLKS